MRKYTTDYVRSREDLVDLLNDYSSRNWRCIQVLNWNEQDYTGPCLLVVFEKENKYE